MIYLVKTTHALTSTASAECDKRAAALESRGYTRCACAVWRSARRANEKEAYRQLAIEDWLARQNRPAAAESTPLSGALVTITS